MDYIKEALVARAKVLALLRQGSARTEGRGRAQPLGRAGLPKA